MTICHLQKELGYTASRLKEKHDKDRQESRNRDRDVHTQEVQGGVLQLFHRVSSIRLTVSIMGCSQRQPGGSTVTFKGTTHHSFRDPP